MPCNWNSQSNYTIFKPFTHKAVIKLINKALFNSRHTTTYKFAFFKSIIDNIFNISLDRYFLSYDVISFSFAEIYWNLVLYHGLKQIRGHGKSVVEKNLFDFCNKNEFYFEQKQTICIFEVLSDENKLKISNMIKNAMKRFVVGAFCGDTDDQFYHFDKKNMDGIELNPTFYNAILKYKCSFEKLNYYAWIKFLEEVNCEEKVNALATKLDSSTERKNLTPYRNILLSFGQTRCFYCGRILTEETGFPVDHFIPWSYVKDDKIWNFVLACKSCNSKKSNTLPKHDLLKTIDNRNICLKNYDSNIVREEFKTYSFSTLSTMYSSAVSNGFSCEWSI